MLPHALSVVFSIFQNGNIKILIFVWVNDAETLRTYGSKTDAYAVFRTMLDNENPPDDWKDLLKKCNDPKLQKRFKKLKKENGDEN